uniref:Uncharacterized protein n=1 Tax=Arundo donax TaxID=35708 RepID=A0A0A9CL61_ARUDO
MSRARSKFSSLLFVLLSFFRNTFLNFFLNVALSCDLSFGMVDTQVPDSDSLATHELSPSDILNPSAAESPCGCSRFASVSTL